jgi:hypothetical protein
MALHGWEKCDDGRLYHSTVAQIVTEAWERKTAQRQRTEAATAARRKPTVTDDVTSTLRNRNGDRNDARNVNRNDQRNGQRNVHQVEVDKKGEGDTPSLRSVASSPLRYEEDTAPLRGAKRARGGARESALTRERIFDNGLKLLGKKYRPLIAKMLETRGHAVVEEALHDIDLTNPDDPAKAFSRLCAEPETPKHRGPDGPPPTVEEAERRWNELERLQR